ncbi:MAG: sigma-70 family RNA polymerase sigma factor [Planctomycetota bacterium]
MGPEEYQRRAMEHLEAVYRLAYHLTRRADDAEDLVQDTYLRALKPSAVARFDESREDNSGMRSWLMAICHNAFYTSLRKKARVHATTDTFYDASDTEPMPGEGCPTWSLAGLDWEQVDGSLKRAIDELKPEFRAVLLLWGVEGLKYREIATILEVPIGTIMSRLHRARALVCEALAADPEAQAAFGLEPGTSDQSPATQSPTTKASPTRE